MNVAVWTICFPDARSARFWQGGGQGGLRLRAARAAVGLVLCVGAAPLAAQPSAILTHLSSEPPGVSSRVASEAMPVVQASPPSASNAEPTVLRLGILAYMGAAAAQGEWQGLQRYLRTALPQYRHEFLYGDLDTLSTAVAEGRLDFVLTNPGHYVELESAFGVRRIATLEHGSLPDSNIAVGAAVVALRQRDDLQALSDLKHRRLAATAENAFGGYQTVWRELHRLRLGPERDLDAVLFTGFPMQQVLDLVASGEADAGVVRACLLESLPAWQTRFKVLSGRYEPALNCTISTPLYPNWPMAGLPGTHPVMGRSMAIALLQMDADEHGLSWAVPADYQVVHEVFRELQIGPYAYLRSTALGSLVREYWPFGMLVLLGLFFWGLYTARSEYLVRTRTAALEQALREREAFEQRMRANQEQADHLARLSVLGELSSTLAHELSQPLAGVNNYAQSLLRRLENGRLTDDAVREASESIVTLAQTAAGILKRIKGFGRKRTGARELHALQGLVGETVVLFRGMQLNAPDIEVVNRLPESVQVRVDALQIQQILLNFFKNAQDAMRGLPVEAQRIQVTLEADQNWVWLHVRDVGPGMGEAELARLFEPFYTSKEEGLGLGLSICKGIAESHGGQLLGRKADHGAGMIFSLSLPLNDYDTKPGNLPLGR